MLKKIIVRYNNWTLGRKLLFGFLFGSIIPILSIQLIGYYVNKNIVTEKVDQLMVSNLTQISERVHLNMETYSSLLYQLYTDEQLTESIKSLMDITDNQRAFAYNKAYNSLKQYNNDNLGIRCISLVCADGSSVVADFQTDSAIDNLWRGYKDLRTTNPYIDCIDEPSMVITPTMKFQENGTEGYYFHMSKRVFDFDHLEQGSIATIIMSIDERILAEICNKTEDSANKELSQHSLNFILDENRQVITYPDESFVTLKMNPRLSVAEFVKVTGYLRDKNTAINEYKDPQTGWVFYNVYDKDYMLKDLVNTQKIFLIVGASAVIFVTCIISYTVYMLNRSVRSVLKGIGQVQQGHLDVVIPEDTEDEIGIIARNFNTMTVKVKELVTTVKEAQNSQKNAEIRALEAQINPHFLYNTLDSINWMAIEKGEYEISTMLRNLGVILRYSVNKSNQRVTIWEMSDWLHKYISLQKMRFNDAFTYSLQIDKNTEKVKVYKLLLQPFVENSIIHGFDGMMAGGLLRIECSLSEDGKGVVFIIEDNGVGMPESKVQEFNDPKRAIIDDGRSIGLNNAFSRMYMYYGNKASWTISSLKGLGTVITLRLPVIDEMRKDNEDINS